MEKKNTFGDKRKSPGRPKGTPNKTTTAVREALILAQEGVGGVPALIEWAKENQTEFYKLWSKLLPMEVNHGGSITLESVLAASRRLTDESTPT